MLLPSGPANTPCSVCRFDPGGLHVQLSPAPGTALQSPETGSQNRRYRDLGLQQRPHAWYLNRGNARKLRAICRRPGNAGSHRTAWWGWKDSNLQPDWYELEGLEPQPGRYERTSSAAQKSDFPAYGTKGRTSLRRGQVQSKISRRNGAHFGSSRGSRPSQNSQPD